LNSGLLNALDGVAASEGGGRILFMTTNFIEKLHPILIRPGRVDVKEYFGLATKTQLKRMFLRFYPQEEGLADSFSQKIPANTVSMAQLQGYLMSYKENPKDALQEVHLIQSSSTTTQQTK
jgi:chaperone BCS1